MTTARERPIVGISTYAVHADWVAWRARCLLTPRTYVDKVVAAGGVPLLVPPQVAEQGEVTRVVGILDALVLIGGEDLCGVWSSRDETPEDHTHHNVERDAFELAMARAAWDADLPLLGVCRGAQVLNVSRGGTLIHDLVTSGATDIHRKTLGVFHEHSVGR
jgi:gamma-glutamyl-gamma-aminobutyrate hydrolase PuuD